MSTEVANVTTGEISTVENNNMAGFLAGLGVTKVIQVTRTVYQQIVGVPFAVLFEGAAYEGEELVQGKGSSTKMQPARMANIVNLETGSKQVLIMNTVLEGELVRYFGKPDMSKANKTGEGATGSYVGRHFAIKGIKPIDAEGKEKRYRTYEIAELFFDGEADAKNVADAEIVADATDPVAKDGKSKPKG